MIHGNSLEHVSAVYKRYLEGRFREHFKLIGTPLRIEMRVVAESLHRQRLEVHCQSRLVRRTTVLTCIAHPSLPRLPEHGEYREQQGQLLQDPFLNLLRKEHVPVSIYLVNGIKLQGHIESFDQYVVLLRNTVTQMVYKHAISTVVPARAVNFSTGRSA